MRLLSLSILCLFSFLFVKGQSSVSVEKETKLMGCKFVFRIVAENESVGWNAINKGIAEVSRIEKLISSWDENSQTSEINRNAGIVPVKVDKELYDLIHRAKKISALTNGAFDISFASMDKVYVFDRKEHSLPSSKDIEEAKSKINWENIELMENNMVFLKEKGMKIGFGAIGKGYAANKAKALIEKIEGVQGGIVNASGDLLIWGKTSTNSELWDIKISDPKNPKREIADLSVNNCAVVTSGNYEKFFTSEGKRFAHIINPRTGYPTSGIKSVTIICPDAEIADALATSVFVLGKEEGLFLINKLKNVEGIILTDDDEIIHSENLKLNYN